MTSPLLVDVSSLIPLSDAFEEIFSERLALCERFEALPEPRSSEQHTAFNAAFADVEQRLRTTMFSLACRLGSVLQQAVSEERDS